MLPRLHPRALFSAMAIIAALAFGEIASTSAAAPDPAGAIDSSVAVGAPAATAAASPGPAASAAGIERSVLFRAGENAHAAYRIPALVTTPQGTVLAAVEARRNSRSDWADIEIFFRLSRDNGRTWSEPRALVTRADLPAGVGPNPVTAKTRGQTRDLTIGNPTWIADAKRGRVFLLFCVEYMRCFVIKSTDGGETFSKPREITSAFEGFRTREQRDWRVIATGPGHGVQLASGRLVAPVWLSLATGRNPHSPSFTSTIYSDDDGKTWQSGNIVSGNGEQTLNSSEAAIVETSPGHVLLSVRTESKRRRRLLSRSADGAAWSAAEFADALWDPVCMAGLARLPDGTLLFSNPASEAVSAPATASGPSTRRRENLSLRTSRDEGHTWSAPLVLEPGPSAYSDLTVAPDGAVLCLYETGVKDPYETVALARVPISALPETHP